jgi:hypothetical protein
MASYTTGEVQAPQQQEEDLKVAAMKESENKPILMNTDDSPFVSEGEDDSGSVSTSEDVSSNGENAATTAEDEETTWSIALQPKNLYKLVTMEDKNQIHKLLGVVSLVHYIFRFVSLLLTGSMGFEHHSTEKILFFFGIHALLSWSSLIFHLPSRKNRVKPMIWPELRLHNIVFASRSIADAVINTVFVDVQVRRVLGFAAAVIAMFAADRISDHFRRLELITKQDSTMRSMPWPKDASPSLISNVNTYYALSQLFATAGVINISRKWTTDVELALTTLFAIQLSALLMTLVRKSILGSYAWHFWYQVSLGLSWVLLVYRYSASSPVHFVMMRTAIGCFIAYHLRFRFNANKYWMWTFFALADSLVLDAIRHVDFPALMQKVRDSL